jgi:DeoR/GlpR family transcriptional regulator of sugar metabolism
MNIRLPKRATGKKRYAIIKYLESCELRESTIEMVALHFSYTCQTASRHLRYLEKRGLLSRKGRTIFVLKKGIPNNFNYASFDTKREKTEREKDGYSK